MEKEMSVSQIEPLKLIPGEALTAHLTLVAVKDLIFSVIGFLLALTCLYLIIKGRYVPLSVDELVLAWTTGIAFFAALSFRESLL